MCILTTFLDSMIWRSNTRIFAFSLMCTKVKNDSFCICLRNIFLDKHRFVDKKDFSFMCNLPVKVKEGMKWRGFFSCGHAILELVVSVGRSIGRLVGQIFDSRACPTVCDCLVLNSEAFLSVRWSVSPFVGPLDRGGRVGKLSTRPQLVLAVYPAFSWQIRF